MPYTFKTLWSKIAYLPSKPSRSNIGLFGKITEWICVNFLELRSWPGGPCVEFGIKTVFLMTQVLWPWFALFNVWIGNRSHRLKMAYPGDFEPLQSWSCRDCGHCLHIFLVFLRTCQIRSDKNYRSFIHIFTRNKDRRKKIKWCQQLQSWQRVS